MLPGLKRQCSNCIGKYINSDNVLQVLRSARLFNQARLEDQCSEFIANNLVNVSSVAVEISCIGIFWHVIFALLHFLTVLSLLEFVQAQLR